MPYTVQVHQGLDDSLGSGDLFYIVSTFNAIRSNMSRVLFTAIASKVAIIAG